MVDAGMVDADMVDADMVDADWIHSDKILLPWDLLYNKPYSIWSNW